MAAMLPPLALAALGAAAWARGMVSGVWVGVLDVAMALAGLALLLRSRWPPCRRDAHAQVARQPAARPGPARRKR